MKSLSKKSSGAKASNGASVDLIDDATFLMDEWEIPAGVLLFATSEDGMYQCFVINYDLSGYPQGAVLYVDTDPEGPIVPFAESVDTFLSQLGAVPSGTSTPEEMDQNGIGIKGVRYGSLSVPLQEAISVTPTPDIEKLLRKATEPITRSFNPSITANSAESRLFYDVVYWIVQHVEPQYGPETYDRGGREGQKLTFPELIGESFKVPGQKYGLGYSLDSIILW